VLAESAGGVRRRRYTASDSGHQLSNNSQHCEIPSTGVIATTSSLAFYGFEKICGWAPRSASSAALFASIARPKSNSEGITTTNYRYIIAIDVKLQDSLATCKYATEMECLSRCP
jgi:hypothetical protein